jgi:hypothetical protein
MKGFLLRLVIAAAFFLFAAASAILPSSQSTAAQTNCFSETGYCIGNTAFAEYFTQRGGVQSFGFPTSRVFRLHGFPVQMFQGHVMQLQPNGQVSTLNLLQAGLMPVTRINGSVFPPEDPALVGATPKVGAPDYASQMVTFTRQNIPNEFEGKAVNFASSFDATIDLATAFPNGGGNAALKPLLALEIWGAPTSHPMRDPTNPTFVYQRFQRSIMHFREACACTERILLADWFKAIITGQGVPSDLAQQMSDSPFRDQWAPGSLYGLARPGALPESDLTNAFVPELPGHAMTPAAPQTSAGVTGTSSGVSGGGIIAQPVAPLAPMAPAAPLAPAPAPAAAASNGNADDNDDDGDDETDFSVQVEDDDVRVGDIARITIIAKDDDGIDWIRWEANLVESFDDDNENANDNEDGDNDEASDNGNDNSDDDADPALTAEHEFDCDGHDNCANVWTITTTKRGRYEIVGEVRDNDGNRREVREEIEVR